MSFYEDFFSSPTVITPLVIRRNFDDQGNDITSFENGIDVVRDSPGVGQNLRDHPQVRLIWEVKKDYQHHRDGHIRGATVAIRYTASGSDLHNDMMVHHTATVPQRFYMTDGDDMYQGVGMTACLYLQLGAGELTLRSSEPNIQPTLNYI